MTSVRYAIGRSVANDPRYLDARGFDVARRTLCLPNKCKSRTDTLRSSVENYPESFASPLFAGPFNTSPCGEKRDPWQGQSQVRSVAFQATMQSK